MADTNDGDSILVLGLGRFGGAIAETLTELGREVLAVDADHKIVQSYAGRLTHVVEADTTSEEALRQIGAGEFDCAVVGIGTNIEASILTTSVLVDLGVSTIWARRSACPTGASSNASARPTSCCPSTRWASASRTLSPDAR